MGRAMPRPIMGTVTVGINMTFPSPLLGTTTTGPSPISPPYGHHGVTGRGCLFPFGVNLTQIGDGGWGWGLVDGFQPSWGLPRSCPTVVGLSKIDSNHRWEVQDHFQPSLCPPTSIPTIVGSPGSIPTIAGLSKIVSNHRWIL